MDTTLLNTTRHVLKVMDTLQKGHLVEVWKEVLDMQDHDQDMMDLESHQDFLRRVSDAEPGTIENGQEYIVLVDRTVQDNTPGKDTHIFHTLEAVRYRATLAPAFQRV